MWQTHISMERSCLKGKSAINGKFQQQIVGYQRVYNILRKLWNSQISFGKRLHFAMKNDHVIYYIDKLTTIDHSFSMAIFPQSILMVDTGWLLITDIITVSHYYYCFYYYHWLLYYWSWWSVLLSLFLLLLLLLLS